MGPVVGLTTRTAGPLGRAMYWKVKDADFWIAELKSKTSTVPSEANAGAWIVNETSSVSASYAETKPVICRSGADS
eukprot:36150-Rhodomonas_salina.6